MSTVGLNEVTVVRCIRGQESCLHRSDGRYCLMDASKVGASGLIRFAGLADLDAVVMDADPEGMVAAVLEGSDTSLMVG